MPNPITRPTGVSFKNFPMINPTTIAMIMAISLLPFIYLKSLKYLDLSSNGIEIIEKNFFQNLTNLEKLYLQNSELNSLQLTFLSLLKSPDVTETGPLPTV